MARSQDIQEKIAEFRKDPQKMEITTKFVNDVIAEAKVEAMNRSKENDRARTTDAETGNSRKRGRWHSRARGFFSRLFSSFCFCSTETKGNAESLHEGKLLADCRGMDRDFIQAVL